MKIKLTPNPNLFPPLLHANQKPIPSSFLSLHPLPLFFSFLNINQQNSIYFYNPITEEKMGRKLLKKGETPDQFQTELYDTITKIEADVLQKIQRLKGNTRSYVCQHFTLQDEKCQSYDPASNYYDKFWKRFFLNEIGKRNIADIQEHLDNFQKRIEKIEALFEEREKKLEPLQRNRRKQRRMNEAQRFFCDQCSRSYKDEETLLIHKKIKHREDNSVELKVQNKDEAIFEEDSDE